MVVDAVEMLVEAEEMFIAVGRLAEDVVGVDVGEVVVEVVVVVVWVVAVDVWNLWWMLLNSCFKMVSALKFYNHIRQFYFFLVTSDYFKGRCRHMKLCVNTHQTQRYIYAKYPQLQKLKEYKKTL